MVGDNSLNNYNELAGNVRLCVKAYIIERALWGLITSITSTLCLEKGIGKITPKTLKKQRVGYAGTRALTMSGFNVFCEATNIAGFVRRSVERTPKPTKILEMCSHTKITSKVGFVMMIEVFDCSLSLMERL